ncbi:MAG TPA: NUDIX hydrolase, partial [Alcanivorax sp.]|nr:NUDIX hydrolase [Alcanivorax sp.]
MKTVYENPWFGVIQDGRFHYIKETGADNGAVVLARQGGDFLFVRVRRPAHGATFIEAPRGYGEPGESAAR